MLLRVSDCLEDHEGMNVERKVRLLKLWDKILEGQTPVSELIEQLADLDSNDPEVYVAQKAGELIKFLHSMPLELQRSIIERVARTTLGMARWQLQGPYVRTVEEMDDYMHQVSKLGGLYAELAKEAYKPVEKVLAGAR